MDALDGNAIAGELFEHFGREMTATWGSCAHCGASAQFAQLRVYARAPGTVGRCPTCGNIVIVLVQVRDTLHLHGSAFRLATGDQHGQ